MSIGEHKGLWWTIAALAVVISLLIWIFASSTPFLLVILFDEIGDLKKGDPVVWKEFNIGRVEKIEPLVDNQIGVTIRLREDYAGKITRGSQFVLRRAAFLGLVGNNAIEVTTPRTSGPPFDNGEKVQGMTRAKPSIVEAGKRWTQESWQKLKDQSNLFLEEFRSSPLRADLEDALKSVQEVAEQGARQAREGLDQFQREHQKDLDAALRKLERIRDELRKKGDQQKARRVEEQIEQMK